MSQQGNTMITMMFTVGPDATAEGDRLFASHALWMGKTHHKEGDLQLLSYNVTKSPEYSNPLDPTSEPTGNMIYTVNEVYKNAEGLADHWKQAQATWEDFGALMAYSGKAKLSISHGSPIMHSHW